MNILGINFGQKAGFPWKQEVNPSSQDQINRFLEAVTRYAEGKYRIEPLRDGTNFIQEAYEYNNIVYSIVSYIIETAGMIPWVQYKKTGKAKAYLKSKSEFKATPMGQVMKRRALEEADHPIIEKILKNPNPMSTWPEFVQSFLGYMLLTGNGYVYKIKPNDGPNKNVPVEAWVLPSNLVRIKGGGIMNPVDGYTFTFSPDTMIDKDEILHIKKWNPRGYDKSGQWLYGLSPIVASSRTILRNNQAVDTAVYSYANSGAKGILSDETIDGFGETGLSEGQYAELGRKYHNKYSNPKEKGKILITAGKWKWTQIGLSPVDLGILESEKWDMNQIANAYKFPKELLNSTDGSSLNSGNRKEAGKQLYQKAIMPVLDLLKDGLNDFLISEIGDEYFIEPDYQSITELQEDYSEMASWLNQAWWIKGDAKLAYMGWEETGLPEMQVPLIPSGYTPLIDFGQGNGNPEELDKFIDRSIERNIEQMFNK